MARDAGGGKAKRSRLFDDLSIAQVVAGALAAVTSMLLASQIGIYGSVIGGGVGSVVSAVASQLYKKFFTASAEKLRELKPGETGYVPPAKGASDDAEAEAPDSSGRTAARHAAGSAGATATLARRRRRPARRPHGAAGARATRAQEEAAATRGGGVHRVRHRGCGAVRPRHRPRHHRAGRGREAAATHLLVVAGPEAGLLGKRGCFERGGGQGDVFGLERSLCDGPVEGRGAERVLGLVGRQLVVGRRPGIFGRLGIFGIIGIGLVGFVGRLLGFVGLVGRLRQRQHGGWQRIGRQRAVRQRLARFRLAAEFGRLALQFDPRLGDPKLGRRRGCRNPVSGGNEGALRERSRRGRPCPGSPAA